MPGREYEEAVTGMLRGFHEPSVDDALVEDEWGVFLSGYAPLRHGDGRYMINASKLWSPLPAAMREQPVARRQ